MTFKRCSSTFICMYYLSFVLSFTHLAFTELTHGLNTRSALTVFTELCAAINSGTHVALPITQNWHFLSFSRLLTWHSENWRWNQSSEARFLRPIPVTNVCSQTWSCSLSRGNWKDIEGIFANWGFFWWTHVLWWDHWYPCFELLVTSVQPYSQ